VIKATQDTPGSSTDFCSNQTQYLYH